MATQPLPAVRRIGPATLAGLALLLLFAALYLLTLDDGLRPGELAGGDLITHQYAQVQGRPSNAPGYPLYTMGGWLWFRVGRALLGQAHNPIQILSSYSTFWALLALWLLYRLLLRTAKWPVAFLVTAFYGVTYFFWYYAVTTEQYASAVAWTLAVVLLAFRWADGRRDRDLLALALLMGVALAHMLTVLAILPPLLWFVLHKDPGLLRRPRLLASAFGLALLPLLSYLFVYVRGAQHPEWRGAGEWTSAWQWFLAFVSTKQGRGELTWSLRPFFTAEFPALIWRELTWPGLLAGLAGIAALGRRRAALLYITLLIYLVFCWIDRLGNWYQVIMPAYALIAVGLGAGIGWLWRMCQGTEERTLLGPPENADIPSRRAAKGSGLSRASVPLLLCAGLTALVLYRGLRSYPRADASGRTEDTGLQPGWAILADEPPAGTAVLGTEAEELALNYLTEIWGRRPDIRSVTSAEARTLLQADKPLAVTVAALPLVTEEVSPDAHYSALGATLIAVRGMPDTAPPPGPDFQPWQHDFSGELQLIGGRFETRRMTGETVVLLFWQAPAAPAQDWSVSVRLTRDGAEIAQQDQAHPVAGAYPTARWSSGEVVADAYAFHLPPGVVADGVTVIPYRTQGDGSFVNLDVARFTLR